MSKIIRKNIFFIVFISTLLLLISYGAEGDETNISNTQNDSTKNKISSIYRSGYLSPAQLIVLINKNKKNPFFSILDVRRFNKFINSHIPGSVNISFYRKNFKQLINGLDREMVYVIYSESGKESREVLDLMTKLGFKKVYVLKGGFKEWLKEGYSIEKQYICTSNRE